MILHPIILEAKQQKQIVNLRQCFYLSSLALNTFQKHLPINLNIEEHTFGLFLSCAEVRNRHTVYFITPEMSDIFVATFFELG